MVRFLSYLSKTTPSMKKSEERQAHTYSFKPIGYYLWDPNDMENIKGVIPTSPQEWTSLPSHQQYEYCE